MSIVPATQSRNRSSGPEPSDAETEEDQAEPGILEYAVQMQVANERVGETATKIGALTEGIGTKMNEKTKKLNRAQQNLGDRAAGALLVIARDSAEDLDNYANEMEAEVVSLRNALDDMTSSVNAIARARSITNSEEAEALELDIAELRELETALAGGVESIAGFASTLFELPHVERKLTAAAQRSGSIVSESAEVMMLAEAEFARARGLLEERLREFRGRE